MNKDMIVTFVLLIAGLSTSATFGKMLAEGRIIIASILGFMALYLLISSVLFFYRACK